MEKKIPITKKEEYNDRIDRLTEVYICICNK